MPELVYHRRMLSDFGFPHSLTFVPALFPSPSPSNCFEDVKVTSTNTLELELHQTRSMLYPKETKRSFSKALLKENFLVQAEESEFGGDLAADFERFHPCRCSLQ